MLSLSYIVEKMPLYFRDGDSNILKKLMLKNDNEFLRFKGKEQFDKKVKKLYPGINIDDLFDDFFINQKICSSVLRIIRDYREHGSNMAYRFYYEDGFDDSIGLIKSELICLNGVTRPINDAFWNTYLPPNYIGDNSSVRLALKSEVTDVPEVLPKVDNRFVFNLTDWFLNKLTPRSQTAFNNNSSYTSRNKMEINLDDLLNEVIREVFLNKNT